MLCIILKPHHDRGTNTSIALDRHARLLSGTHGSSGLWSVCALSHVPAGAHELAPALSRHCMRQKGRAWRRPASSSIGAGAGHNYRSFQQSRTLCGQEGWQLVHTEIFLDRRRGSNPEYHFRLVAAPCCEAPCTTSPAAHTKLGKLRCRPDRFPDQQRLSGVKVQPGRGHRIADGRVGCSAGAVPPHALAMMSCVVIFSVE